MGTRKYRDGFIEYAVELERGGKVCRTFARSVCEPDYAGLMRDVGTRERTQIPVLDEGRKTIDEAQRILDGYARLRGWEEI